MTNLIYLLAFVFILGSAVILHEFGHFIVAKLLGIRVETFSVGFGKRLWGRKWGTTDYRLSLIPLGGYVKLGGDDSNAGLEEGGNRKPPAFIGQLKGATSFRVNKEIRPKFKLHWQEGYGVLTLRKVEIEKVARYIDRQEEHHRRGKYCARHTRASPAG